MKVCHTRVLSCVKRFHILRAVRPRDSKSPRRCRRVSPLAFNVEAGRRIADSRELLRPRTCNPRTRPHAFPVVFGEHRPSRSLFSKITTTGSPLPGPEGTESSGCGEHLNNK